MLSSDKNQTWLFTCINFSFSRIKSAQKQNLLKVTRNTFLSGCVLCLLLTKKTLVQGRNGKITNHFHYQLLQLDCKSWEKCIVLKKFFFLSNTNKTWTTQTKNSPVSIAQIRSDDWSVVKSDRWLFHSKQLCSSHLGEADVLQCLTRSNHVVTFVA